MLTFGANTIKSDSIEQYQIKVTNKKPVKPKKSTISLPPSYRLKIHEYPISIAELNVYSKSDKEAVDRLIHIWGEKSKDMPFLASMFGYAGESPDLINSRFFILTRQNLEQDNFFPYMFSEGKSLNTTDKISNIRSPFLRYDNPYNKPDPSAILGIAQTTTCEKGVTSLDILCVNPFYTYDNPYSDLKKIGTTLLENIKNIFKNDELIVFSPREAVDFFLLRGFNILKNTLNREEILMTFKEEASKARLIK